MFRVCLLLLLVAGCAKEPDYSGEERALARLRETQHLRQSTAENSGKPIRDEGAEAAKPAAWSALGLRVTATRILLLVDISGSMMSHTDTVRAILKEAVDAVDPQAAFNVVAYHDDGYDAASDTWMLGTSRSKSLAHTFIESLKMYGSSDPIPALRAVYSTRPEAIVLLADGDYPNNAQIIDFVRSQKQAGLTTQIHTIGIGPDDDDDDFHFLKQLATETGGEYRGAP